MDLHRFDSLLARARTAEDDDTAVDLYELALSLWRGDPFGVLDTPWANTVRDGLRGRWRAAVLDRNEAGLRAGQHGRLLPELMAFADVHPLDERLGAQVMLAQYRSGRQADALGTYQRMRLRLADTLGADPGPALRQLHQRILTADVALDLSVTTAASQPSKQPPPVPRQLPAAPRRFAGRTAVLAELNAALDTSHESAPVVIGGAGGIGKTWLAMRWAHDHVARFPDGQLYVNLRGFDPANKPVTSATAVRMFLDALGVDSSAVPSDPDAQAALYRSLIANRRMLIIIDHARDSAQVAPLLPGTPHCTVLVTSRRQLPGLLCEYGALPMTLDVLTDGEARELLTAELGTDRIAAEPAAVAAILHWCTGLPLALSIVAARAASCPGLPLAVLATEMRSAATRLDALDGGELAVNLRAVLASSYQALPPDAARVFALLGLSPGPDLSLPAAASLAALPTARVSSLLRQLIAGHLVQEPTAGRYRMHDLVRLFAAEQVPPGPDNERRAGSRRILDHYLHTAHTAALLLLHPHRDPITPAGPADGVTPEDLVDLRQAMHWFTTEHGILLAAVDYAANAGFDTHTWQLARILWVFLDRCGHWRDMAATQRTALDAALRLGDRTAQGNAHRGLAHANTRLSRDEEATIHARRALEVFVELDDQAGQARVHLNLGLLSHRRGRHREALSHAEHSLRLYRSTGRRVGQAYALNDIGCYHIHLGDHEQGLRHCRQALALSQDLDDPRGQAPVWDSLGLAHHRRGDHHQALGCYQHALRLFQHLGDRHGEADVLSRIGDTHHAAAQPEPASTAWQHALTILDELHHPDADIIRIKLAGADRRPATDVVV